MRIRGKDRKKAGICLIILTIICSYCSCIFGYAKELEETQAVDTITIGYFPDKVPLSFTDSKTGEFSGITRYILDELQKTTGLKFRYVELPTDGVSYTFIRKHQVQFISGVEKRSTEAMDFDKSKIYLTKPYLTAKEVFVARLNFNFLEKDAYTAAVAEGNTSIIQVLQNLYPDYTMKEYSNIEKCFHAVKNGEADVLMQNQYVADYYLQMPTSDEMQVLPVDGYVDELCLAEIVNFDDAWQGSLKGRETEIFSIVNRGLSVISKDQLEAIIAKATMETKYKLQTKDVLYKYKNVLLVTGSSVAVVLLFMTYVILSKRKMAEQLKKQLTMQEKLVLEQERYSFLVEKTQNPVFELNFKTMELIISDKMLQKFGWTLTSELTALESTEYVSKWRVHAEDLPIMEDAIAKAYKEHMDTECLVRLEDSRQNYRWVKISRYPLLDTNGNLISVVGQIIDVDEDMREKEHLQRLCQIDGLTKLLNKKAFTTEARKYFKENTGRAALIFVDLDHFKQVNDNLGHLRGDQVIRDAARKLQLMFANVDLVARFGGDEFCLLIKNIPEYKLKSKLEWAVFHMRQMYQEGDFQIEVTTSIGAYFWKRGEVTLEYMMDMADKALYEAKENGRDQFVLHSQK